MSTDTSAERGSFDAGCRSCPRLATYLARIKARRPDYHAAPVPPFGDPRPRLLIVGLAPGLHGANRTGRPFTGDHAGILLYRLLYEFGMATHAESMAADDDLRLKGVKITNAVKCVPPQNKPTGAEINTCNRYLRNELASLPELRVVLALGRIAHYAVVQALELESAQVAFAHAAEHALPDGRRLVDSYHCSRYNLNTRRLTAAMFRAVLERAIGFAT